MDYSRSLPNDLNNKIKKIKKVENKSVSGSSCSPDSYNLNSSNKKNWKLAIAQDGELFFIKRSKKPPASSGFCPTNNSSLSLNQNKNIPLNLLKLSTIKNADINKELYLIVSAMDRYRFGRRSSIIESMLGFGVVPFSDNFECLMIANIIDNSIKLDYPYIQEGDWFKSMDNIEVRTENIDKLLLQYTRATKVRLTFKSSHIPHKESEEDSFDMGDLHTFEDFALNHKQLFENKTNPDNQDHVFLTLIIDREYFQDENNECLFYYPFLSNNFLYTAKGSFLTLDSLITNDLRSKATQSTITVNHIKYFITYGHLNETLVVCAFSSTHQSKQQTKPNSDDFINFLKFNISDYQSLEARQYLGHVCDVFKNNIKQSTDSTFSFGLFTGSSLGISLPKEAQLRICDALSEFESMDHKKWNETHKTSSDLIVCGTALYYGKFLLSSNLPVDLRTSIECFLRVKGMSSFQNISEMFIWEEIKNRLENNANKHYLAICLRKDLMLITVLKSPQQQLTNSNTISCIPYMEEIANTVDYLLSSGIDCISQFWIDSAKRPSMKKISQSSAVRKFTIQKDISLDYTESNNVLSQESPPHSLLSSQPEDGTRRNFELESVSDGFNDFKEYNKDCENIGPLLNEVRNIMPMNWTAGWSNDLKFFLHWNCADAILMSPLKPMCSEMHLSVIKENILNIHNLIHSNSNCKRKIRDTTNSSWNRNVALREHGISVNLKNHDSEENETIFIIGRLFSFPLKEIFVCFGPNYSQNLVELAFRMSMLNVG